MPIDYTKVLTLEEAQACADEVIAQLDTMAVSMARRSRAAAMLGELVGRVQALAEMQRLDGEIVTVLYAIRLISLLSGKPDPMVAWVAAETDTPAPAGNLH